VVSNMPDHLWSISIMALGQRALEFFSKSRGFCRDCRIAFIRLNKLVVILPTENDKSIDRSARVIVVLAVFPD
jgi:hypothetical protein